MLRLVIRIKEKHSIGPVRTLTTLTDTVWHWCKTNQANLITKFNIVCFASSQVWSELQMQTTSWNQCHSVWPRGKTSRLHPITCHTFSTGAGGTSAPTKVTKSFRDLQETGQTSSTAQLTEIANLVRNTVINMAIGTWVTSARWSITAVNILTTAAITMEITTGTGRSTGSTFAGEGRNVCKGYFSYCSTLTWRFVTKCTLMYQPFMWLCNEDSWLFSPHVNSEW